MTCLHSLSFSNCSRSLPKRNCRIKSLLFCTSAFCVGIGFIFFNYNISHLFRGSYAIGTALCAIAIISVIAIAVRDAKKKVALKNGRILVKNPMLPIQSVKFTDQSEDAKRKTPMATSLSFASLPEFVGARILSFMELQGVFNFSTVNHHWKQLSKKAIAVFNMCRKYFIPIDKHELTKGAFKKFKKVQSFTQSVKEQVYNDKEKTFSSLFEICFKDDKAYLNFLDHIQVWDSELKKKQFNIPIDLPGFKMMLIGNMMHCYLDPYFHSHLKLLSFDIKTHSILASRVTFLLKGYGDYFKEMKFTFSKDKAFASKKDGSIAVWDLKQRLKIYNDKASTLLRGHKKKITHLVYQNDLLYSTAKDNKIKIWNFNTRTCLCTIDKNLSNQILDFEDFVVNSRYICGRFYNYTKTTSFKIWDQKTKECVQTLKLSPWIHFYCMHGNLLIFYVDNEIRILDLNCGQILRTIKIKYINAPLINLQVVNDKIVALLEISSVTHVCTFDFTATKLSDTKISDQMEELDSTKLS